MKKRRIIGIGETILDVIFRNEQPTAAVPGGSVFNGLISLARLGLNTVMITETGADRVGKRILEFMENNHVNTSYVSTFEDGKSPLSLAFLNEQSDAEYEFYKDYPNQRLTGDFPEITKHDIVIFGSYYALNPVLREGMLTLLEKAQHAEAIIYYDPNFRSSHCGEAMKLAPTIIENLEFADIVRGSNEDFQNMWNMTDRTKIYEDKVAFYCPNFIYTQGDKGPVLYTSHFTQHYPVDKIEVISSIGAGDNFNAGILYGLLKERIYKEDLADLDQSTWEKIIQHGLAFSKTVCQQYENSISQEWADSYL